MRAKIFFSLSLFFCIFFILLFEQSFLGAMGVHFLKQFPLFLFVFLLNIFIDFKNAFIFSFLAGIMLDFFSGLVFGSFCLIFSIISCVIYWLKKYFSKNSPFSFIVIFLISFGIFKLLPYVFSCLTPYLEKFKNLF